MVAKVATVLLDRGRLPFQQICQLVYPISPKDVRICLMILIQHHLIWQHTDTPYLAPAAIKEEAEPDKNNQQGQDYYEPNQTEILHRLQFGTFLGMAEEIKVPAQPNLKGKAFFLIFALLQHGRRRIKDLLDDVLASVEYTGTRKDLQDVLTFLASQRYIEATTPLQASYPLDRYRAIRTDKMAQHSTSTASSKAKREAEQLAKDEFIEERSSDLRAANDQMFGNSYVGAADLPPPSWKRRRDAAEEESDEDSEPSRKRLAIEIFSALNEECMIRVNYARFLFRLRSEWIETAIKSKFGQPARLVARACLALVEEDIVKDSRAFRADTAYSRTLKLEDLNNRLVEVYEDHQHLNTKKQAPPKLSDYYRGCYVKEMQVLSPDYRGAQTWNVSRAGGPSLIKDVCDRMAYSADVGDSEPEEAGEEGAKPSRRAEIHTTAAPKRCNDAWLEQIDAQNGSWRFQFHVIHKSLKRSLVLGIIEQEQGKEAVRIMRILDSWGRLDEKTVHKIALMTPKEVRKIIDSLLDKGYIQSQECPRSSDRVSSRSMFLWYIDWTKAYQTIRSGILQQLGNIATRKAFEQEKHSIAIAKSQKPAVQANRDLMEEDEWQELDKLQIKLEYLRTAEARALQDLTILELPESQVEELLAV